MITTPRIWYVCDKCREWFYYKDNPDKLCPNCKKGKLVKTCAYCGDDFDKCRCTKKDIDNFNYLNKKQLKKDLIEIWTKYIKNPDGKANIKKAVVIYYKYMNAVSVLPKNMVRAINNLVDIINKTGIIVSKEKAADILSELKK